ncbi:MAG TPA: hypothetical protein VET23_13780 [Chitinophagaceae bacterium]|nr:hypothetical protein [Chitinophagaceae bacterium]
MKTLFAALLITLASNCFAQNPNLRNMNLTPINTVPTSDWFSFKRTVYYDNEVYVINGNKVYGTPFLYHNWAPGVVIGVDGSVFSGYQLKYDAYNQTVLFQKGTDSLEITNVIQEFTLNIKIGDSTQNLHFVNANQYKKEQSTFYYQVLSEGESGQFLCYNRKFVNDEDKSLPALEGKKYFDMELTYYYYDKNKKKLNKIRAGGGNIESLLGADNIKRSGLSLKDYNFSSESDMVKFFDQYFEVQSKKAF